MPEENRRRVLGEQRATQSCAVVKMRGRRCVHQACGDPTEVTRVARNGGWGA
jgi:hypothetical protein